MVSRRRQRRKVVELHPDEILLDVHNLPEFNVQQFEGRIERPISRGPLLRVFIVMACVAFGFVCRLGYLQIFKSQYYETKSEQNSLNHIPVFADRGLIYDRNGVELAWNSVAPDGASTIRQYIPQEGYGGLLGYVSYPAKDAKGNLWQSRITGKDAVEKQFDTQLAGQNGTQLIETNVSGKVLTESTISEPTQGENLTLSIDNRIQETLYNGIKTLADDQGFVGGAGAVMNIQTGELLAMTTYPQYDPGILSAGKDSAVINGYLHSSSRPFLNRMVDGLYTPGSIVKPFFSLAALHEGIISPNTVIHTTGSLRVPNPYAPGQYTIFKDNANHGDVNMAQAIAVSSDVYFYEIGGGFGSQRGLGIANIDKYSDLFGMGKKTGFTISGELGGTIPSIAWKAKNFPKDPIWRIGDTYHTSIGQYGFQVTPLQMLRAVAGIASRGTMVSPTILKSENGKPVASEKLPFTDAEYQAVFEGMRMVTTGGTAAVLNNPAVPVAAKTGTAQIKGNTRVNSWAEGFFPYDNPKYAFIVLMEDGPKVSAGATHAMKPVVDLYAATPELLSE